MGGAEGFGAGAGADMSKRSPILLAVVGGGLFVVVTGGKAAEEKSPKSPPKLSFRGAATGGCEGGDMGFEDAAGFMSKKDPPLRADLAAGCCFVWPAGGEKLVKGDGFGCVFGGEANDSELNASFIPLNCVLVCG